ncbi:MAG TPA: sigma-70 family RNA polymerase sigma factor [Planctomycetes bacterium]|nr:sigma-70 family RNA polymerase sigma factor [Planctomycetota bacterium]
MQVNALNGGGSPCAPRLGRFEFGIVKRKVRQIVGRAGYTRQDKEDLEQELLTRLLQGLKSFDPDVAHRKSFVTAIVERAVATILRDAEAQKRDHRRISSLQRLVDLTDEGPTELAETIGDREYNGRRCRDPRSDEDLSQLVTDLAEVIDSMPGELRDLAERMKTQSISAIAREIGVPRTTLNDAVRRLRQRFEQTGLRDYL